MTTFNSLKYKITSNDLEEYIGHIDKVDEFTLKSIQLDFHGYGHYKISYDITVNGVDYDFYRVTTDMRLTDTWKSVMKDIFDNGECGYESEDEVIKSILDLADFETELTEQCEILKTYIIMDKYSDKYVFDEDGTLCGDYENCITYKTEDDAEELIEDNGWEDWAYVSSI